LQGAEDEIYVHWKRTPDYFQGHLDPCRCLLVPADVETFHAVLKRQVTVDSRLQVRILPPVGTCTPKYPSNHLLNEMLDHNLTKRY